MISRYEDAELEQVWSPEGYRQRLILASIASLQADPDYSDSPGQIGREFDRMDTEGRIGLAKWRILEAQFDHDLAAWVELVRRELPGGMAMRWHRKRTSSDLADTALGLGILWSHEILNRKHVELTKTLAIRALELKENWVLGRTHGQYAEWTSIGRRFAVIAESMVWSWSQIPEYDFGKLSGPVGTWGSDGEWAGLMSLGLRSVPSTQIVPRARLAGFAAGLAAFSVNLTDLATLIRLGSREVAHPLRSPDSGLPVTFKGLAGTYGPEWCREARGGTKTGPDGTSAGRGSSAMPQKRNPIRSEKVSGLAKLIRSNCYAVVESSAGLWEERDISHSSVERIALVDALHLTAHCLSTMTQVIADLEVKAPPAPEEFLNPTGVGALEALIEVGGMSYTEAYERIRSLGPDRALEYSGEMLRYVDQFNRSMRGTTESEAEQRLWSQMVVCASARLQKPQTARDDETIET